MTTSVINLVVGVAFSFLITRAYYRRQVRQARLAEVAAESQHDQLLKEMLRVSDAVRPDQLVQRTGDTLKTIDGETVTSSDGEVITTRNYERLASRYEELRAPIMAGIVRQAAELERYESMTLEDAYREGLIEPDPENCR